MASITEILPTEIIEIIIENLAAPIDDSISGTDSAYIDAFQDLKACSLACHGFLPLCRKHIFKTIDFSLHDTAGDTNLTDDFGPKKSIAQFAQVIETSPTIGSYVQALALWLVGDETEVTYSPDTALRSLTKLRSIELCGWPESFDWNDISSSMKSELYHLFHIPTITSIFVTAIQNFSIQGLAHCVGLEACLWQTVPLERLTKILQHRHPSNPSNFFTSIFGDMKNASYRN